MGRATTLLMEQLFHVIVRTVYILQLQDTAIHAGSSDPALFCFVE